MPSVWLLATAGVVLAVGPSWVTFPILRASIQRERERIDWYTKHHGDRMNDHEEDMREIHRALEKDGWKWLPREPARWVKERQ